MFVLIWMLLSLLSERFKIFFIILSLSLFISLSMQVYIKVIDTNDHRPEFSTWEYQVTIPEDTMPETEILKISASDRDEKNKLIYTMQGSTDPFSLRKFRLDPATGSLYTSEHLDHEFIHQHVLIVMVKMHIAYSSKIFLFVLQNQ